MALVMDISTFDINILSKMAGRELQATYVPLPPLESHPSVDPFCSTKAISVTSSRRDAGLDEAQQQDL